MDMALEMQGTSGDSDYYGIGKFVENSRLQEDRQEKMLEPGTLLEDSDFEELTASTSEWATFVRGLFPPEAKESVIKKTIRFYGFLCQWITAIIKKAGVDPKVLKKSRLTPFLGRCEITEKVMKEIDGKDGKGSMVLLRVCKKVSSPCFSSTFYSNFMFQFFF